jgi:hypothetical protein
MNVEIGNEAVQFPDKEYINETFVAMQTKGETRGIPDRKVKGKQTI